MDTEKPTPKAHQDAPLSEKNTKEIKKEKEIGGFEHTAEPTRYGDWEVGGRCSDF